MSQLSPLQFIKLHGVVLASGKGPAPNLAEYIAGAPIRGSWWGHPEGHAIYAAGQMLAGRDDVVVLRLVKGKLTYVHKRLWPALAAVAPTLPAERLASVRSVHTPAGHHERQETPWPVWVPDDVLAQGAQLDIADARRLLGPWLESP